MAFAVKFERGYRQAAQRRCLVRRWQHLEPRQRPRAFGRCRHRAAHHTDPAAHGGFHLCHQRAFAIMAMEAAGHVEDKAIRRFDHDQRRETVAGIGNRIKPDPVGGSVRFDCDHIRHACPRIRERHTGREAEVARCGIAGSEPHRPALLLDEEERFALRRNRVRRYAAMRLRAQPVGREKGEPQRQESPHRRRW